MDVQAEPSALLLEDRVRWPINRLSYEELKPGELATVEKLFANRDDAPALMKWVLLHKNGRFYKRLVVISAFRLWLLQRKKPFKTQLVAWKEAQLMHIQQIYVLWSTATSSAAPTASIQLFVAGQYPQMLHFDPGVHTESVVRLLQRLLHGLRLVFPAKQFPKVHLPPQYHWEEFFPATTPATATNKAVLHETMMTAYRAFCDDLGVPYRPSVSTRLAESAGSCVDFQYILSFPPGVNGYQQSSLLKSSSALNSIIQLREVQALARTLGHCHCFESVVVYDLMMNEVGMSALFQALLSPFSAITAFALTNVDLTARSLRILQHVVLQSTIKRVQQQPLQLRRLDFSFNRFSQSMANEMATIFELLPSGLEVLQLEQCSLSPVSNRRLLLAMKANPAFSSSLRELNLSGNNLNEEGTRVLSNWLTGAFALHRLDVSQSRLDLNVFFQALRQNSLLHESSLRVLDLSYNRMRSQASQDLGWILGKTQSLSTVFLRGMQRQFSPRTLLLQSLTRISKHALARVKAGNSHCFTGLKKTYLRNILAPMFKNTGRALPCLVDLSENDLSGDKADLLARLVDASPFVGRASLRLDYTRLHDKTSILLLHSLRACRTLTSLSLEGNGYVQRNTASSLQRFHEQSSALLDEPSAIEVAAANAFALILGGSAAKAAGGSAELLHKCPSLSDVRTSSKPLPLRELCLKSDSTMIFGPHVITTAAAALKFNQSLQVLDVSGNECGDALAHVLGAVLRGNKSLQVLFWDDNFTTVDGFIRFYDGLVHNQTLVMVQMPIRDTRRILEEQKDPPRDKLFGILGKIFKITERNQTLAKARPQRRPRRQRPSASAVPLETKQQTGNQDETRSPQSTDANAADESPEDVSLESKLIASDMVESQDAGDGSNSLAKESAACVVLPRESPAEEDDHGGNHWSVAFSGSMSARYPSTMKSWSLPSRDDVLRASWTQLTSFGPDSSLT